MCLSLVCVTVTCQVFLSRVVSRASALYPKPDSIFNLMVLGSLMSILDFFFFFFTNSQGVTFLGLPPPETSFCLALTQSSSRNYRYAFLRKMNTLTLRMCTFRTLFWGFGNSREVHISELATVCHSLPSSFLPHSIFASSSFPRLGLLAPNLLL